MFCSCKHRADELPGSGVQVVAKFYQDAASGRVGSVHECGQASDPTIYNVEGRELFGTMIPEDDYERIRLRAMSECAAWARSSYFDGN